MTCARTHWPSGLGCTSSAETGSSAKKNSLAFDLKMRPPVGAVIAQRHESLRRVHVDAVFVVCEMWAACAARRQNQIGFSALRGNPDEIGVSGLPAIELAILAVVGISAQRHDARAIGRPSRIAVHAGRFR